MIKTKLLILLLLPVLLLCSCAKEENAAQEIEYLSQQEGIYPFYAIGRDDMLYRVQRNGNINAGVRVNYSVGGKELNFIRYIPKKQRVVCATDIRTENGVTLCSLAVFYEKDKAEINAQNVRFESIRVSSEGNVLFIDKEYELNFLSGGIIKKVASDVYKAEFVGTDEFLYLVGTGKNTDGSFEYPIYYATADSVNYLLDAYDIVCADEKMQRAYIINNKHIVQKRASHTYVAECFVYSSGEIRFSIKYAIVSRLGEDESYSFIISCNTSGTTLTYDINKIDGDIPVLYASGVLGATAIDGGGYIYETLPGEKATTNIVQKGKEKISFPSIDGLPIDKMRLIGDNIYVLSSGKLYRMLPDKYTPEEILEDVSSITKCSEGILCYCSTDTQYSVYFFNGESTKILTKNSSKETAAYSGGYLYYYTGEGYDLSLASQGGDMAYISNIDPKIGILTCGDTVAVAKADDKSLFIASKERAVDTQLKIKKIVMKDEVL